MEYIVNACKFTFKHPLILVILVILSLLLFLVLGFSSTTGKAPRVPFVALVLYMPAIIFIGYCIAGAYSIIWKMFSDCQEISLRVFIQGANRYFWIIIKVGIIVGIFSVLVGLPGCIRTYSKIKVGDTGYTNTIEGWLLTMIPSLIIMCLFMYVTPYIYVFDVRRVVVIGKGCKFFIKHFSISAPVIVLYVVTSMIGRGITQVATLCSSSSPQYRLVQSSGYLIHFYLSIIVFLAAAQILKKYHKEERVRDGDQILKVYHVEEDEEWIRTECNTVVPADAKICPNCGSDVSEIEEEPPDLKNPNPRLQTF